MNVDDLTLRWLLNYRRLHRDQLGDEVDRGFLLRGLRGNTRKEQVRPLTQLLRASRMNVALGKGPNHGRRYVGHIIQRPDPPRNEEGPQFFG